MYQAFFGLREKPFNLTPDPKFLYLNSSYREALASLHYAIAERKGFAALVGEAGTGKTTLLRRLLSELPRDTRSVLVINPAVSFEELLRFILTDLGRPPSPGTSKLQMTEALNAELLDTLARGGNVVVLIDEAQDLTIPVLEELRLLSNLETAKEKILQFVLAGQPEFESMLARPEIRQLRQRIAVNARLRPLGRREVKAYVAARIASAGGDERGLFRPAALYRLWRFSAGVPRLVNVACDNALVTAYAAGKRTVGWKGMGEAVRDLSPAAGGGGRRFAVPAFRLGTIAAAAILGAGGAYGVSRMTADSVVEPPVPAVVVPQPVTAPARPAPPVRVAPAGVPEAATARTVPALPTDREAGAAVVAGPYAVGEDGAADAARGHVGEVAAIEPLHAAPGAERADTGRPAGGGPGTGAAYEVATEPADADPAPDRAVAPTRVVSDAIRVAAAAGDADAAIPAAARQEASVRYVRVEHGDTITAIAYRHYGSVTPGILEAIKRANPELRNPDVIMVGGMLVLPPPNRRMAVPGR